MNLDDASLRPVRPTTTLKPVEHVFWHGSIAGAGGRIADGKAWTAHLDQLGLTGLEVTPDPVRVATEGALWGAVSAHGFLCDAVVVSDDAGQFDVGTHALCWIHAERLVHKLEPSPTSSAAPSSMSEA